MIHQRCMEKLRQTARLRFPGDEDRQASYIADVLAASERHDETHYWIDAKAFSELAKKYGPAKRIDPTPEQQALIDTRKAICELCEHNQGFTLRTVKCADCGCSGVSLISGRCKLGKWDTP